MKKFVSFLKQYHKHILILILFAIAVPLTNYLTVLRSEKFPVNLDRSVGVQIFTQMIGEVRTIIASYIYIRADMYHHERDDKIDWRKDAVTLPLHRIVTALDPKFEQAYDFGAYQLAVNFKKYPEAIKFLREGLDYNPGSFKLTFTMGDIFYYKKDYETAAKWHKKALKIALKKNNRIDIMNSLRRLYWEYRKMKNYDEAEKYIKAEKAVAPDHPTIKRMTEDLEKLRRGEEVKSPKVDPSKAPGHLMRHHHHKNGSHSHPKGVEDSHKDPGHGEHKTDTTTPGEYDYEKMKIE
ncbi:MAG: hypothetical protein K8T10_11840 [Candidatus Eremiobacteraeota bacterium]|nr:hypothetical protein [Candidatus Eremiobacteraeota bacterium]